MNHLRCAALVVFLPAILFAQKKETDFRAELNRLSHPASVEDFQALSHLSAENQDTTLICWSFATSSFVESEMKRLGLEPVRLSVMYPLYCVFLEKAKRFAESKGESRFAPGDLFAGVVGIIRTYGAVPAAAYEGEKKEGVVYSHNALYRELESLRQEVKKKGEWDEQAIVGRVREILDRHLGAPPVKFQFKGKEYTPASFASDVVRLPWKDYILVTSFTYAPFGTMVELKVPDNWKHDANFLNVPLDAFYASLRDALRKGYTAAFDADISEPSYERTKAYAFIPASILPPDSLTQSVRERMFESGETTDDHLMQAVSWKKFGDEEWFLVKDSWRTAWEGPNGGYMFFHSSYMKLKTLAFLVHRDAVQSLKSFISEQ